MIERLLIANRGEIAIRIMRAAAEMGIATVAVASRDDSGSLHLAGASEAIILNGTGPAAYLDFAEILRVASETRCVAVHPGYGFLSENSAFARACAAANITFVGPTPDQLDMLGNKTEAKALAARCDVPVLAGASGAVSLDEARGFMANLGRPVMVKALSGGGGRGIRLVASIDELDAAFARCQSEALRSFGDNRVYVEQALTRARHIEVQIVGDGTGAVAHLGERDCTVQRRNQKLVEIAPSPTLPRALAGQLHAAAIRMATEIKFANVGTFEFLVELDEHAPLFYFLESNPRLQVEHTVTEELWGVDLVRTQLLIADGARIADLQIDRRGPRSGYALQTRINMERLMTDGTPVMDGGTISVFEPPAGPGVRVDTYGYRGYTTNLGYDSLLAKLIVSTVSDDFAAVLAKAERTLGEFKVHGVATNITFLRAIVSHPLFTSNALTTRFVDEHLDALLARAAELAQQSEDQEEVKVSPTAATTAPAAAELEGIHPVLSPMTGVVVNMLVEAGQLVTTGQALAIVEAMKMEYVIDAPSGGIVHALFAVRGATVRADQLLLSIAVDGEVAEAAAEADVTDLDVIRPDLAQVLERQRAVLDVGRPEAVARRRAKGWRTARENVDRLCDPGSFVEFGSLAVAAQRRRRTLEELIRKTPGDGVVVGFGKINGKLFSPAACQSLIIAFDETVLAGTTGETAREKMKHALAVAYEARRPVVLFAEGGGGRAGDTDGRLSVTGWTMDVSSYYYLGRMSALTPLVGITNGRCFAANAGMLAVCDVIIATEGSNIGVGGPSMIEGGRLGSFTPEEIGPMDVQTVNGVVDILVADEQEAVDVARQYLSYFQGPVALWEAPDQRVARTIVPENRLRAYSVRKVIDVIADVGSVLELRPKFGIEIIVSLVRVEGRPLGIIANNPLHLGGAINTDGADKASRFMHLCEAFGLPILFLCDTPGVMVGPEAEKFATVRRMGRMFVIGSNLTVPFFTIVLRKAYGIGAVLMAGGWFKAPRFVVSWPTGEFGGMNIEGNVKLGHAAELNAIADPRTKQARFEELVAQMYSAGRALSVATHYEIDAVIDPAESRKWIMSAILTHSARLPGSDKTMPFVDPW